MKRIYTSPAIETTDVVVEQGIATSQQVMGYDGFGLGEDTTYDTVDFDW